MKVDGMKRGAVVAGLLAGAIVLGAVACGEPMAAPQGMATLAIRPTWSNATSANAVFGAGIDTIQVDVYGQFENPIMSDTIAWPSDKEAIRFGIRIPMTQRTETVYVYIALRAGQDYLYNSSAMVEIKAYDPLPEMPSFPLYYSGPGYDAQQVVINPDTGFYSASSNIQFNATVYGFNQAVITAPIAWSVSDTSLATIDQSTGLFTPRGRQGAVRVRALTPNGTADSGTIQLFVPVP